VTGFEAGICGVGVGKAVAEQVHFSVLELEMIILESVTRECAFLPYRLKKSQGCQAGRECGCNPCLECSTAQN
jgi:hypothetical protein